MPHSAKSSDFASQPMQSETKTERGESTMTPEKIQYTAKLRATHDVPSRTRRSVLAATVVGGTFLLLLLAAVSYAQTFRTADAQAFVTSPLPEKQSTATQDVSIRAFHIK